MSWMAKLYETYEAAMLLDLDAENQPIPISHTPQNAHIKVTVDGEGVFVRAEVLPRKTKIILPATEQSAGRSGKLPPPHPLADKIRYVAADYASYGGKKEAFFDSYLRQLTKWCQSEQSHLKVRAVRKYIALGDVVKDLVENNILHIDDDQNLLQSWPKNSDKERPLIFKVLPKESGGIDQGNALVCWSVEIPNDPACETWTDQDIQKAWIAHEHTFSASTGLCYVSGKQTRLATIHPAKLRTTGDKAKLVSSNDMPGYTFRGRFTDSKQSIEASGAQAVGVSYEVTQKAHNALRWLIARQGFRNSDQAIIAWAVSGAAIPAPLEDGFSFLYDDTDETASSAAAHASRMDHTVDLGQSFSLKLGKYMAGYRANLKDADNIIIMGIDSATPGRMAITYYQEFLPDDYIDRISKWHEDFAWFQRRKLEFKNNNGKNDSTTTWPASAPSPFSISEAIFGKPVKESLAKNTIERILPCIVEARLFPRDLVTKAIQRVSNRVAYKNNEWWLWEIHLGIACALFRGFSKRNAKQSREYKMGLEKNRGSRDYLFGRLLAIAESIEEMALYVAGEKRSTTAARLMHPFAGRPSSTWRTIELALSPYVQRLKKERAGFLNNTQILLDEVMNQFAEGDFNDDKPLSGEFLLAYHCQRLALRNKPKTDIKQNNQEEGA